MELTTATKDSMMTTRVALRAVMNNPGVTPTDILSFLSRGLVVLDSARSCKVAAMV